MSPTPFHLVDIEAIAVAIAQKIVVSATNIWTYAGEGTLSEAAKGSFEKLPEEQEGRTNWIASSQLKQHYLHYQIEL